VICIAAGFAHSLAVTARGTVFSWGCGTNGRLGHGSHCDEYIPRQIQVLTMSDTKITSLAAGVAHSLFLSDTGLVFGCGLDSCGQVGAFTCEKDLSHDSDGKVLKPLREASNKVDGHSILCPQPVDFPIQLPAATTTDVENVGGLNHCSCSSIRYVVYLVSLLRGCCCI
jgi:alpha-tubulin suppressor-like RCC1 family protein